MIFYGLITDFSLFAVFWWLNLINRLNCDLVANRFWMNSFSCLYVHFGEFKELSITTCASGCSKFVWWLCVCVWWPVIVWRPFLFIYFKVLSGILAEKNDVEEMEMKLKMKKNFRMQTFIIISLLLFFFFLCVALVVALVHTSFKTILPFAEAKTINADYAVGRIFIFCLFQSFNTDCGSRRCHSTFALESFTYLNHH